MLLLSDIIRAIEEIAPRDYQETYDNSGLIAGNPDMEIQNTLIALDCTEKVLDEAIEKKCQLVISHHPIVFSGLRSLTGKTYVERVLLKAIKHDIAIYAAHTNLDNVAAGVNKKIADKLELTECAILEPKTNTLKQLHVYVPDTHAGLVRDALFSAGGGQLGNYASCSFNSSGLGTFMPLQNANPFIGEPNTMHTEKETRIEVIFPPHKQWDILMALKTVHPYEEIAYGITTLENQDQFTGAGMTGLLENEMTEGDFMQYLKVKMNTACIRHTPFLNRKVKKVAICGGSGSFLLQNAIRAGADVFISADFKYHQFFDADQKIVIADIGHYESEQFTGEIFYEVLSKKYPNFAFHLTSVNTNPINYY